MKNHDNKNAKKTDEALDKKAPDTTQDKPAEKLVEHTVTGKEADHYPLEKQGIHIGDTVLMTEEKATDLEQSIENTYSGKSMITDEVTANASRAAAALAVENNVNGEGENQKQSPATPQPLSSDLQAEKQAPNLEPPVFVENTPEEKELPPTPESYDNDEENTFGKRLVRTSFNPSHDGNVANIKMAVAKAADSIYYHEGVGTKEYEESKKKALDALELVSFHGVKAATAK